MELTDREILEAYLASIDPDRPRRSKETPIATVDTAPPKRRMTSSERSRCACGRCQQCADNARWERIFNERFADPDYYNARPAHQSSSLNSWR